MKTKKLFYFLLCSVLLLAFSSCESDEKITKDDVDPALVKSARNFLTGDIVLGAHATMNGVSKTLLPEGCPTKFIFTWSEEDFNTLNISLKNFSVGAMPLVVNFSCDTKIMQLNSWEQDTYTGSGWIKFYGTGGMTSGAENADKPTVNKGSSVKGYYNVDTHEINFIVNYNMMNVRSECYRQIVNKDRINHFEEEFAQFEKDLAEYKKEHGL